MLLAQLVTLCLVLQHGSLHRSSIPAAPHKHSASLQCESLRGFKRKGEAIQVVTAGKKQTVHTTAYAQCVYIMAVLNSHIPSPGCSSCLIIALLCCCLCCQPLLLHCLQVLLVRLLHVLAQHLQSHGCSGITAAKQRQQRQQMLQMSVDEHPATP